MVLLKAVRWIVLLLPRKHLVNVTDDDLEKRRERRKGRKKNRLIN